MIFEVFLLTNLWDEKSKALLGPDIFFNYLLDHNLDGGNSFGQFKNLEEEKLKGR